MIEVDNIVLLVSAVQKNAAAKLNVIYQNLEYLELSETRIRRADLTAFVVAVVVEGRNYVGVGKTKKEARCEAAEQALRHLRLWTDRDEKNKRMVRYGIDEEDPVEMVMRLRVEAGHPPCLEDCEIPNDPGFSSSWDDGRPPGGWGEGHNNMFSSRGSPPPHFRGPDFRPPMFRPRGRFDSGPRDPRLAGPNNARPVGPNNAPFARGFLGERPNRFGRSNDGPNRVGFNAGYGTAGPNQAGLGRGRDTVPVPFPPKGRGNTSMTQGIPRGQLQPQGGIGRSTAENKKPPPPPIPDRPNRFGPSVQNTVVRPRPSSNPPRNRPVTQTSRPGTVPTRPNKPPGQLPFSVANTTPLRKTTPETSLAAGFNNYGQVTNVATGGLHTAVPDSTPWNPMSSHGQQTITTFTITIPSYSANAAVSTTAACGIASVGEQYDMNTAWTGATQADYYAYYSSYLQSLGVSDTNSFANMSVPGAATNQLPASNTVPTNEDYASQALAYANNAAAYYNAFYGAGGYADPTQTQLQNYLYSYANNKPT